LNSTIAGLARGPFDPIAEFKGEYRCIAADLRNANAGQSSGPLEIDRPWDAYTDDQLGGRRQGFVDGRFERDVMHFCNRSIRRRFCPAVRIGDRGLGGGTGRRAMGVRLLFTEPPRGSSSPIRSLNGRGAIKVA
jgi:hypothetical protein